MWERMKRITMRPASCCVLVSLCVLAPMMTHAQTQDEPPRVSDFDRIFRQPTGVNGYEDLVMAGDLLHGNAAYNETQVDGATLFAKRRALADRDVQAALTLLRRGLAKPMTSLRPTFDGTTTFPEYASFRSLARLLSVEQYLLLADGEIERAIQNLGDGFRLAQAARTDHVLISELVGHAIDRIATLQIGKHLDQLSERNCDSLSDLLEERLAAQPSAGSSLIRERDFMVRELERLRAAPKSVLIELIGDDDSEPSPETTRMVSALAQSPSVLNQAVDDAQGMLTRYIEAVLASLQLPLAAPGSAVAHGQYPCTPTDWSDYAEYWKCPGSIHVE